MKIIVFNTIAKKWREFNKEERFEILNSIAKYQLDILNNSEKIKLLRSNNNI